MATQSNNGYILTATALAIAAATLSGAASWAQAPLLAKPANVPYSAAAAVAPASTPAPVTSAYTKPKNVSPTSDYLSKSSVAAFQKAFGVTLIQDTTPMAAVPPESGAPTARLRALQKLAAETEVTWRKVYRVSPATADMPVTTASEARRMVDQDSLVSLQVKNIPTAAAAKSVASADNAIVKFTGAAPASMINLNFGNVTLPAAIAALAKASNTHWQAVYLIAPIAGVTPTPDKMSFAPRPTMTQQQWEATQLNNKPVTIHVAPQPVQVASDSKTTVPGQATQGTYTMERMPNGELMAVPSGQTQNTYSGSQVYGYPYSSYNTQGSFGNGNFLSGSFSTGPNLITEPSNNPYNSGNIVLRG